MMPYIAFVEIITVYTLSILFFLLIFFIIIQVINKNKALKSFIVNHILFCNDTTCLHIMSCYNQRFNIATEMLLPFKRVINISN
jgi:hypothetical protein